MRQTVPTPSYSTPYTYTTQGRFFSVRAPCGLLLAHGTRDGNVLRKCERFQDELAPGRPLPGSERTGAALNRRRARPAPPFTRFGGGRATELKPGGPAKWAGDRRDSLDRASARLSQVMRKGLHRPQTEPIERHEGPFDERAGPLTARELLQGPVKGAHQGGINEDPRRSRPTDRPGFGTGGAAGKAVGTRDVFSRPRK